MNLFLDVCSGVHQLRRYESYSESTGNFRILWFWFEFRGFFFDWMRLSFWYSLLRKCDYATTEVIEFGTKRIKCSAHKKYLFVSLEYKVFDRLINNVGSIRQELFVEHEHLNILAHFMWLCLFVCVAEKYLSVSRFTSQLISSYIMHIIFEI